MTSAVGVAAHVPLIGAAQRVERRRARRASALALDVGEGSILDGLADVRAGRIARQLVQVGGRTILDDCYNANPRVDARRARRARRDRAGRARSGIAVLGDMLELGAHARAAARARSARYARERGVDS